MGDLTIPDNIGDMTDQELEDFLLVEWLTRGPGPDPTWIAWYAAACDEARKEARNADSS